MSVDPSRRVRVTAPTTGRRRRTSVVSEIDAATEVGAVYMRSLMRMQLRLALRVSAVLVLTVGALPLLFLLVPFLRHGEIFGAPVAWLLLGGGCYPILIGAAVYYQRRSERNEQDFHDLVTPPDDNTGQGAAQGGER